MNERRKLGNLQGVVGVRKWDEPAKALEPADREYPGVPATVSFAGTEIG